MFRSLRVRMAASHAAVLAIILFLLGGGGLLILSRSLDRSATDELTTAAQDQVARIQEAGIPLPPPDTDIPSREALRIGVYDAEGRPVGEAAEYPSWLRAGSSSVVERTVAGEEVRVVTIPVLVGGERLATVVAGRSLAPEERLLHRVRLLLLTGGAAAIVASLFAGWWLAGRAVRPVERAYEAQAGFAADASHELRTPLTFIRSGVEVLAEHDRGLGEQVLSEVDYLTGLTQRMLMLARAERGTLALERVPFDLDAACRSAAARSTKASGTRLRLDGDPTSATGDRIATEAALDALLENVNIHGGGQAEVRWCRDEDRATVIVADHGPGLPPELLERVFERFGRADPSRTRDTGGAGLGLAIARALVAAQDGDLWVEPTPGGGLTAKIALPL